MLKQCWCIELFSYAEGLLVRDGLPHPVASSTTASAPLHKYHRSGGDRLPQEDRRLNISLMLSCCHCTVLNVVDTQTWFSVLIWQMKINEA